MKILQLLFFFLLLPLIHTAQICSANAGGQQAICIDDPMVLMGETSGGYDSSIPIQWTVLSSEVPVTIVDPNSLATQVVPAPGFEMEDGSYEFELTITCIDGIETSDIVSIYVGRISNPGVILSPIEDHIETCLSNFSFKGSQPDPGVSAVWSISSETNLQIISDPDDLVFEILHFSSGLQCDYTIYYHQSIGTCTTTDSVTISFTESYTKSEMYINYIDPSTCPTCSKSIRVGGTPVGCNGTANWSVSPNAGVTIESPNSNSTWIHFEEEGNYELTYSIENGDCPTTSVTSSCYINEIAGFEVGPDINNFSCDSFWEKESIELSANYFEGAEYNWEINAINPQQLEDLVTIVSPNSHNTIVTFENTPWDISNTGLIMSFRVTATYENCTDDKLINFISYPYLELETEEVYLLCGGDPFFRLSDYYSVNGNASGRATVILDPSGTLPPGEFLGGSQLNMTNCGHYQFSLRARGQIDGQSFCYGDPQIIDVYVGNVPTINAGSDIETCLNSVQLNGNTPLDIDCDLQGIPVNWEFQGTDPDIEILNPTQEDPIVTGLSPGDYTFKYSFSQEPGCIIEDVMTVTVLPESECELCEIDLEINGECRDGCIQLLLQGNAEEYFWTPQGVVDDSNPNMPVICNTEGGVFMVTGLIEGRPCGTATIEIPECQIECDIELVEECLPNGFVSLSIYQDDQLIPMFGSDCCVSWTGIPGIPTTQCPPAPGLPAQNFNDLTVPFGTQYAVEVVCPECSFQYSGQAGDLCDRGDGRKRSNQTNKPNSKNLTIYPIPAKDFINIHNPQNQFLNVQLFNIAGALVKSNFGNNSYQLSIPTNQLPQGLYFLKIADNEGNIIKTELVPIAR